MSYDPTTQLLRDAVKVHSVASDVHERIAALAVAPLDQEAAAKMRETLTDPAHAQARASLTRIRQATATDDPSGKHAARGN